ncbi:hypothetical protein [Shewanella colwelliana]|uniref:Lipoprotein n=1 Tax=Shewanella colwelliana TaxID=23 RepID=A0A1E5ITA1_SHECO|nr:hypothetical protein [Shewanella colwelliana]MDX1281080.1 hypothetical protein [Shewanella colwelliana]OEG73809.1 hypothetical protein BEL05_15270 [Shewanella colwelliana]
MLKKWIVVLIPVAVLGLSGCASTSDTDADSVASNSAAKKTTKECTKVRATGSNISRCKK